MQLVPYKPHYLILYLSNRTKILFRDCSPVAACLPDGTYIRNSENTLLIQRTLDKWSNYHSFVEVPPFVLESLC